MGEDEEDCVYANSAMGNDVCLKSFPGSTAEFEDRDVRVYFMMSNSKRWAKQGRSKIGLYRPMDGGPYMFGITLVDDGKMVYYENMAFKNFQSNKITIYAEEPKMDQKTEYQGLVYSRYFKGSFPKLNYISLVFRSLDKMKNFIRNYETLSKIVFSYEMIFSMIVDQDEVLQRLTSERKRRKMVHRSMLPPEPISAHQPVTLATREKKDIDDEILSEEAVVYCSGKILNWLNTNKEHVNWIWETQKGEDKKFNYTNEKFVQVENFEVHHQYSGNISETETECIVTAMENSTI